MVLFNFNILYNKRYKNKGRLTDLTNIKKDLNLETCF